MKISAAFILLLSFAIIVSCKKETPVPEGHFVIEQEKDEIMSHSLFEQPVILDASKVYLSSSMRLDVDNNGQDDIVLSSFYNPISRWKEFGSKFKILKDNFRVRQELWSSTIFFCQYQLGDTSYIWEYNQMPDSSQGSLFATERACFLPVKEKAGSYIKFESTSGDFTFWSSDNFFVAYTDSSMVNIYDTSNALVGCKFTYSDISGTWSNNGPGYMCFKLSDSGQLFYGWIRMEIVDCYIVKIYEVKCFRRKEM